MSSTIDSVLVLSALSMNDLYRRPLTGLIFHSDRGVQYAASNLRAALQAVGLVPSMSRRSNCCDNAAMESFYSTNKLGLVYRRFFATRKQAKAELFDFIEVFYNRNRHHTALGGLSPALFESKTS